MDIFVVLLMAFNFGISWFNARSCGRAWQESKAAGGWTHFVTWCGAIMSASGFTWVYVIVLSMVASHVTYHGHVLLAPKYVQGMVELGYVIVIFPILGSAIAITIQSWQNFAREKSLRTGGVAAYNTFADIYDTYNAVRVLPGIFGDLGKLFKLGDDEDNAAVMLMVLLVGIAVLGGILTTAAIIHHAADARKYEVQADLQQHVRTMRRYAPSRP